MSIQDSKPKILVVDDIPQNVRLLELNLKAEGYDVVIAYNGQEALDKFDAEHPDMVLLDIMMPIMDGNEVCRRIRKNVDNRWIPIVMITAYDAGTEKNIEKKIQSLNDGADDFIKKPFDRYELLARVRSLLRIKSLQDELIRANRQFEEELILAREVQQALLPQEYPNIPNIEFSHRYVPSLIVGGDFFDIEQISETKIAVMICDVMGHGPQAAMITGIVRALLTQLRSHCTKPDELLINLNHRFHSLMESGNLPIFITAFCMVIDIHSGVGSYANAGHPKPYIMKLSTEEIIELSGENGFAIGMVDNAVYQNFDFRLEDGDMVFMFTDGLQELVNNNIQFGKEELQRAVHYNMQLSPKAFVEAMICAADAFSDGLYTKDDITLLAFKYKQIEEN